MLRADFEPLPGVVGGAVGGGLLGAAVDVVDAGFGLVEVHHGVCLDGHPGVGAVGHGVDGHGLEVAGLDEVVEGFGGLGFVYGVGVDGLAHDVEILFEDGLVGGADVAGVGGDRDGGEDADDDHDDHEFEEGEAVVAGAIGGLCSLDCRSGLSGGDGEAGFSTSPRFGRNDSF